MTACPSKQNYYQISREVSALLSVCPLLLFVCACELFIARSLPYRRYFPLVRVVSRSPTPLRTLTDLSRAHRWPYGICWRPHSHLEERDSRAGTTADHAVPSGLFPPLDSCMFGAAERGTVSGAELGRSNAHPS